MRRDRSLKAWRRLVAGAIGTLSLMAVSTVEARQYTRDNYRDIKWLGRGNAGIAICDDDASAFYNPAGLAANNSYNFNFMNTVIGANASAKDSVAQVMSLGGGDSSQTLSERFAPFLGHPLTMIGGGGTAVSVPGYIIGFWDYLDARIIYENPVYPRLTIDARNDYGLFTGGAYNFMDRVYIGSTLRYVRRRTILSSATADELLFSAKSILSTLQSKGEGYGATLGAQFRYPTGPHTLALGYVIEDPGQTRFKNATRLSVPMRQEQKMSVGVAYAFKSPLFNYSFMFDVRDILATQDSYTTRIFTGMEFGLPLMDLRVGLFQGYWTAGISLRVMPLVDIEIATYGEELGAIAGQLSNRYYMLGVTLGMDLKKDGGKRKQRYSLDNL